MVLLFYGNCPLLMGRYIMLHCSFLLSLCANKLSEESLGSFDFNVFFFLHISIFCVYSGGKCHKYHNHTRKGLHASMEL